MLVVVQLDVLQHAEHAVLFVAGALQPVERLLVDAVERGEERGARPRKATDGTGFAAENQVTPSRARCTKVCS